MIKPRVDLDDEHTRMLTYDQAHAASVEHVDAVASVTTGIASIAGASVSSDIHPAADQRAVDQQAADPLNDALADELTYRAALAALNGVVQRSLRDFLS